MVDGGLSVVDGSLSVVDGGLSVVDEGLSVVDGGHPAPQEADLTTTTTSACVPLATKNRKQTGE